MNCHKLFSEFDSKIKLTNSKIEKLKVNREALRNKVRTFFSEKEIACPKFYSQGSFPLGTNLNPIKTYDEDGNILEEYDLDDGVYFICPLEEKNNYNTYHTWIKSAVENHAKAVKDKATCVRVIYADGHHIDLPIYWLENENSTPQLAHTLKGFIESDPKAFKDWVDEKVSLADSNGQLKRVIRYFKAWVNYRMNTNNNVKLPSGFILTILSCVYFSKNKDDDVAFKQTAEKILNQLNVSFTCYRPTTPTNEELLASKYNKTTVISELEKLVENATKAIDSACEKEASKYWQKIFGDRFPTGTEKQKDENDYTHSSVKPSKPWANS